MILKQIPTFVNRSYKGGEYLQKFLNCENPNLCPEDWISSFTKAKNPIEIPDEGLTTVEYGNSVKKLCDVVDVSAFGQGRTESGVLIKFLDAAERLSIQVHPTKEFALKYFGTPYGKTECWHILDTRDDCGTEPSIYIGFKEGVTKEHFRKLFKTQDIAGMLDTMHRFPVKKGDTILVTAGTPHAIGAGCFLLEIQEPTDYTMRSETTTVSGTKLTPQQIHYGVGEEALLDCFLYENALNRDDARKTYFLNGTPDETNDNVTNLVSYSDTPCFKLSKLHGNVTVYEECFLTAVSIADGGTLTCDGQTFELSRGDKFFISANSTVKFENAGALLCYPPKKV